MNPHLSDDASREYADRIKTYDEQIAAIQEEKRATFADVRKELASLKLTKAEIALQLAAFKAAIMKRRQLEQNGQVVELRDALAAQYLDVIFPSRVARDAHAREGAAVGAEAAEAEQVTEAGHEEHDDALEAEESVSAQPLRSRSTRQRGRWATLKLTKKQRTSVTAHGLS